MTITVDEVRNIYYEYSSFLKEPKTKIAVNNTIISGLFCTFAMSKEITLKCDFSTINSRAEGRLLYGVEF